MFLTIKFDVCEVCKALHRFLQIIQLMMYRLDIKSSEISIIMNVTESTAREWIRTIKDVFQKNKNQIITIAEFCAYKGVPYKDVFCLLNKMKPKEYDRLLDEGTIEEPKIIL